MLRWSNTSGTSLIFLWIYLNLNTVIKPLEQTQLPFASKVCKEFEHERHVYLEIVGKFLVFEPHSTQVLFVLNEPFNSYSATNN